MEPLTVLGVFVGQPRVIGVGGDGRPVTSAIGKERVTEPSVAIGLRTIAGDAQADLTVHGGPDKVVYAYPAPHYAHWRAAGFALDVGGLGENVAVDGAAEHDVRIGDVWRWGDALLQVSQPRSPCYKLALHVGRRGAARVRGSAHLAAQWRAALAR